jgi:DNA-binding CsgD family transcriptional regulator
VSVVLAQRGATLRPEDPVELLALARPVSVRDGELLRMRASGAGIAELSRRFEISAARVRQLLERDGRV